MQPYIKYASTFGVSVARRREVPVADYIRLKGRISDDLNICI